MLLHPLNNFQIQRYENEPKFNHAYSINNLNYLRKRMEHI